MSQTPETPAVDQAQVGAALEAVLHKLLAPAARLEELRRKELLTGVEVWELFGIPEGTLRNMRSQGRGPKTVKIGSSVYYRHQDVQAFISAHQVKTYDQKH